jgi:biopolymer transport protein TolR
MGMSSGGDNNGMMAEINVTPFVDVMLVLLIIFMVTAPMMNQGVQVQLPKATADQLPTDEKALVLSISESGDYFMAEESYDISELKLKLQAIAAANPDKEVFIRADALVPYEKVAQLMAACTQAGITKLGMVTEPGVNE